jgi:TldD protein
VKVPHSEHLAGLREQLRELVRLLRRDYPYASVLATDCRGLRYAVQRRETSVQESRFGERGCVVRVHDGFAYSEYSFNQLPAAGGAEALADELRGRVGEFAAARNAMRFSARRYPVVTETPLSGRWQEEVEELPEETRGEEIIRRLTALRDRAFALCDCLVDMRAIYEGVRVSKLFLSEARDLEQSYLWSQGYLIPVSRKGEVTRVCY